jgi:glutaredoxin
VTDKYYVLITKGSCPACQGAIELLKMKKLNFVFTDMEHAPEVLETAKAVSGRSTVPIIWEADVPVSNKLIGGFDDLQEFLDDKEVSE